MCFYLLWLGGWKCGILNDTFMWYLNFLSLDISCGFDWVFALLYEIFIGKFLWIFVSNLQWKTKNSIDFVSNLCIISAKEKRWYLKLMKRFKLTKSPSSDTIRKFSPISSQSITKAKKTLQRTKQIAQSDKYTPWFISGNFSIFSKIVRLVMTNDFRYQLNSISLCLPQFRSPWLCPSNKLTSSRTIEYTINIKVNHIAFWINIQKKKFFLFHSYKCAPTNQSFRFFNFFNKPRGFQKLFFCCSTSISLNVWPN